MYQEAYYDPKHNSVQHTPYSTRAIQVAAACQNLQCGSDATNIEYSCGRCSSYSFCISMNKKWAPSLIAVRQTGKGPLLLATILTASLLLSTTSFTFMSPSMQMRYACLCAPSSMSCTTPVSASDTKTFASCRGTIGSEVRLHFTNTLQQTDRKTRTTCVQNLIDVPIIHELQSMTIAAHVCGPSCQSVYHMALIQSMQLTARHSNTHQHGYRPDEGLCLPLSARCSMQEAALCPPADVAVCCACQPCCIQYCHTVACGHACLDSSKFVGTLSSHLSHSFPACRSVVSRTDEGINRRMQCTVKHSYGMQHKMLLVIRYLKLTEWLMPVPAERYCTDPRGKASWFPMLSL